MSNSNQNNLLILAAIAAVGVGAYLYTKNQQLEKENNRLKEQNEHLVLLVKTIKESSRFDNQMKQELLKLIDRFKNIDEKVANELAQALQLLQIGQVENAIEDLVKIMEHILKSKYEKDGSFKSWLKSTKRKLSLHNLLEYAKEQTQITKVEYQFFVAVKAIRNEEDHTVDFKPDNYLNASGMITCLGAIMKLGKLKN